MRKKRVAVDLQRRILYLIWDTMYLIYLRYDIFEKSMAVDLQGIIDLRLHCLLKEQMHGKD